MYDRDIHRWGLMKGFPPPKDKRVTIDNWSDTTDTLRWTHLNGSFVFKTLHVDRPENRPKPPSSGPKKPRDHMH